MVLPKNLYFKWLYQGDRSENGRQWNLPSKDRPGKKMPPPKEGEKYSFCYYTGLTVWMRTHLFVREVLDAEIVSSDSPSEEVDYLGSDARLLFEIESFDGKFAFRFACECLDHVLSSENVDPKVESYLKSVLF